MGEDIHKEILHDYNGVAQGGSFWWWNNFVS